jgi:hypothetical protein
MLVECRDIEGLHVPVIGELNIFIEIIVGYIELEGASCPGDRGLSIF